MGQLVLLMANMAVMIALLMPLEVKGASLEDRAVEEMKLVNVADREMTQFWDTFNANWDAYKDDKVKNPNRVCTDHVKLLEELEEIKIQNGLVISAIEALKAQLTQIRVILENAEWGDHSGLHCKETPDEPICVALAALDKEADQAETKANGEKDLVLAEITRVKTYDCNCVWEQWAGKWSACSKTCEEGTKKQTREILWQKRNKGQDCNPADGVESAPCNDGCCPVNCVWDDWKPWGDCPNVCSAETQYMLRTREKKVSMECAERGGKECEGSPNERKECKILEVWDGKIAALVTKHNNLKSQIALYKEKLCDPNPCANGGTCKEGVCTCAAEYEGHHCKTPKEKKESANKDFVLMDVRDHEGVIIYECPKGHAVEEAVCEMACTALKFRYGGPDKSPSSRPGCAAYPKHRSCHYNRWINPDKQMIEADCTKSGVCSQNICSTGGP